MQKPWKRLGKKSWICKKSLEKVWKVTCRKLWEPWYNYVQNGVEILIYFVLGKLFKWVCAYINAWMTGDRDWPGSNPTSGIHFFLMFFFVFLCSISTSNSIISAFRCITRKTYFWCQFVNQSLKDIQQNEMKCQAKIMTIWMQGINTKLIQFI